MMCRACGKDKYSARGTQKGICKKWGGGGAGRITWKENYTLLYRL